MRGVSSASRRGTGLTSSAQRTSLSEVEWRSCSSSSFGASVREHTSDDATEPFATARSRRRTVQGDLLPGVLDLTLVKDRSWRAA